jgi:hypothetical protein
MQKCDYCGRITKYKVDCCPYCGSSKYTELETINGQPYEITDISKINFRNIPKPSTTKNTKNLLIICILGAILIITVVALGLVSISGLATFASGYGKTSTLLASLCILIYTIGNIIVGFSIFSKTKKGELDSSNILKKYSVASIILTILVSTSFGVDGFFAIFLMLVVFIPLTFEFTYFSYWISSAYINFKANHKADKYQMDRYNSLMRNGVLIKNVKYSLEPSSPGSKLNRLKIDYTTSDGAPLHLLSQKEFVGEPDDKDADILIDKTDYSNYFIDLEIS